MIFRSSPARTRTGTPLRAEDFKNRPCSISRSEPSISPENQEIEGDGSRRRVVPGRERDRARTTSWGQRPDLPEARDDRRRGRAWALDGQDLSSRLFVIPPRNPPIASRAAGREARGGR